MSEGESGVKEEVLEEKVKVEGGKVTLGEREAECRGGQAAGF